MKTFNQLLLATAIATISLSTTSCQKDGWLSCKKANGEMATEIRDVSDFTQIHLKGSGDVILIQDDTKSIPIVEVESSSNVLDRIETEVKDNELTLSSKCIKGDNDITYTITVDDLKKVAISGSGTVTTQNQFTLNNLRMNISGSGDIYFNTIADNVQADISGSGSVKLNGTASNLDIDIAGSGDVEAFGFTTNDCFVTISGSGNCQVFANGFLDVNISGSGDVVYDGNPTSFNTNTSGSGSVSRR
jgi:hypothetical protein